MIKRLVATALFTTMLTFAGTYSFAVMPSSGNVQGAAGSTVGWGYQLRNESSTDWLVPTSLNTDGFLFGTGTSLFDFPVLDPGSMVMVTFDPLAPAGLFQLKWDPDAPDGFSNMGLFTISAEWWSGDPGAGGMFLQAADDVAQPYTAIVAAGTPPSGATPEPATGVLVAVTLGSAALVVRRRA